MLLLHPPRPQPALPPLHRRSFLGFSLVADHSYLDEAFGYSVAAVGFYFQWSYGFGMPFPLNIIMLPFDIIEWYIRWSISSGPDTAAQ